MLPAARGLGAHSPASRGPLRDLLGGAGRGPDLPHAPVDYARSRQAFGRPIGGFQLNQAELAEMATRPVQTRPARSTGRRSSRTPAGPTGPGVARQAGQHNVVRARHLPRGVILGANGITDAYPIIRHMLNLETVLTYEGTEEVHSLILGRAITGEDAFQ